MCKKAVLFVLLALIALPAASFAGDWMLRARVINVSPNESSDQILDFGSEVGVDDATTLEVDISYLFTDHFSLEIIAATTKHDLYGSGGAIAGASLGSVKVLPPTAVFQLHPFPGGLFDFYVGAGVNFTYFYGYDLSEPLAGLGVTDVEFDNSFGFAGDIGLNIKLGDRFHVNGDIKYIQISTDATLKAGADTVTTISTDINPWVYGVGVGWRF